MKYQIIKQNHEVSIIIMKYQIIKHKIMKYQIIKHKNHEVSNY